MYASTKRSSIAIAATLGIALSMPLSIAAFADADAPKLVTQSLAAAMLRAGDLVRVRSLAGGHKATSPIPTPPLVSWCR